MDIAELHARALEALGRRVAAVREDQWHAATPCDGWDVRDLVNHLVAGNEWAAELGAGRSIQDVGDRLDGDVLGDDPTAAYDASAARAAEVFRRPGALEAPCAVSYGPVPGEVYAGHRLLDALLHAWDLAVATGQPTDLESDLVDAGLEVLLPQAELFVAAGAFARSHDPGEGSAPQDRLLALSGRAG